MKKICEYCGEEFLFRGHGKKKNDNKKFCSKECWRKSLIGKPSNAFGKKWTIESKEKIIGRKSWNKGLRCPQLSRTKIGNLNPAWKGGISKIQDIIRNSNQYFNWRTQVFGRDNFACQECGKRGSWLEAHHIKSFSSIIKENYINLMVDASYCSKLWELENGVTLCRRCHNKIHGEI